MIPQAAAALSTQTPGATEEPTAAVAVTPQIRQLGLQKQEQYK